MLNKVIELPFLVRSIVVPMLYCCSNTVIIGSVEFRRQDTLGEDGGRCVGIEVLLKDLVPW